MNQTCDRKLGARCGLAMLFLAVICVLLYRGADRFVEVGSFVSHRYEMLAKLDALANLLKDEELALRGFLLTGKQDALKPLPQIRENLVETRAGLLKLMETEAELDLDKDVLANNSTQQERFKKLKPLVAEYQASTDAAVSAPMSQANGQPSGTAAAALLSSGAASFDQVQARIDEMRTTEKTMLQDRLTKVRESAASLAEVVVYVHFVYVTTVVFGLLFVLIGWFAGWQWVRNPWFRFIHLLMILIVVVESIAQIECPLTTWERDLKLNAGMSSREGGFIARFVHDAFMCEGTNAEDDGWAFTLGYIGFGVLVLGSFWIVPPCIRKKPAGCAKP